MESRTAFCPRRSRTGLSTVIIAPRIATIHARMRFNANKLLPRSVSARRWPDDSSGTSRCTVFSHERRRDRPDAPDSAPYVYKSRVVDSHFDWGDDHSPARRGATASSTNCTSRLYAPTPRRAGTITRQVSWPRATRIIAYFKRLGITAVELLPCRLSSANANIIKRA